MGLLLDFLQCFSSSHFLDSSSSFSHSKSFQKSGISFNLDFLPVHGLFKCICRSGANPEKVFCIR